MPFPQRSMTDGPASLTMASASVGAIILALPILDNGPNILFR